MCRVFCSVHVLLHVPRNGSTTESGGTDLSSAGCTSWECPPTPCGCLISSYTTSKRVPPRPVAAWYRPVQQVRECPPRPVTAWYRPVQVRESPPPTSCDCLISYCTTSKRLTGTPPGWGGYHDCRGRGFAPRWRPAEVWSLYFTMKLYNIWISHLD